VVGQPMAILLYTIEYQYGKQHLEMTGENDVVNVFGVSWRFWFDRCVAGQANGWDEL
jgi:hypothetical protein